MFYKSTVALLLLFSFSINADVVKWVDSDGKTHYSNKAPKKHKASAKKIKFDKYKKSEQVEIVNVPAVDWTQDFTQTDNLYQPVVPRKNRQRKVRKVKQPTIAELRAQCDIAREERLAPARAEAIEACIEKNEAQTKNVVAYCERFNRTFGNEQVGGFYHQPHLFGHGGRYLNYTNSRSQRLFHNIPECLNLYRAEDKRSRLGRGYRD